MLAVRYLSSHINYCLATNMANLIDESNSTIILDTNFNRRQEVTFGFLMMFFSLVGVLGNGLTLVVLFKSRRLYNCCTPYLISIAMTDLLACSIALPSLGLSGLGGRVLFPYEMCKVMSLLLHTFLGQSWIGITLLTVVRCVVLWTGEESSFLARWPRLVILASWIMVITTGLLLIYSSWGTLEHTGVICSFFCGMKAFVEIGGDKERKSSKILQLVWLLHIVIPFMLIMVCYILMYAKIRKSRRSIRSFQNLGSIISHRNEVRFFRMTFLVVGTVFVSYVSSTAIDLIRSASEAGDNSLFKFDASALKLEGWSLIVVYLNGMWPFWVNPFIYVATNKGYRRAYCKILRCSSKMSRRSYTLTAYPSGHSRHFKHSVNLL